MLYRKRGWKIMGLIKGIYIGKEPHLHNLSALLRHDEGDKTVWLAQFDAMHVVEAFNWHPFPKSDFINVRDSSDDND
jgi:hypothetical protein